MEDKPAKPGPSKSSSWFWGIVGTIGALECVLWAYSGLVDRDAVMMGWSVTAVNSSRWLIYPVSGHLAISMGVMWLFAAAAIFSGLVLRQLLPKSVWVTDMRDVTFFFAAVIFVLVALHSGFVAVFG
jgi:hypothetical protein